ncbi:hypothetical protein IMY05_006G0002600 [Salix suchowensis]|nr:hypothetical protein IMY05_006G0002600 [Salix suchowensis]
MSYLLVVFMYTDGHMFVSDLSFHSIAVFASFIKYQSKLEECQIFITCAIQGSSASCLKSNSYLWAVRRKLLRAFGFKYLVLCYITSVFLFLPPSVAADH